MTSESNIERWHRRRNAWFTENGPCQGCGTWEDLELDHIDRALKEAHNIWNWSDVRREIELAKCQVLCRPCHIEKSILEGSISQPGERSYINYRRCYLYQNMFRHRSVFGCSIWRSYYYN
jgi:hypothetical protein